MTKTYPEYNYIKNQKNDMIGENLVFCYYTNNI